MSADGGSVQQHCIFELKASQNGQTIKRLECHDHSLKQRQSLRKKRDDDSPSDSNEPETKPLLPITTSDNQSTTTSSSSRTCWTFQSGDHWKLSSEILLKIVYRPSYTSTPAYTNISYCCDVARRACCQNRHKPINFFSVTYTTDDIEKIDDLEDIRIRGIGICRAIRLRLKAKDNPLSVSDNQKTTRESSSSRMKLELERQHNLKEHLTHDWDRLEEKSDTLPRQEDSNGGGPILVFAMPKDPKVEQTAPPLLWKVFLPENPKIALETVTILHGSLDDCATTTQESLDKHSPSHVYINGYQSWSYAGSLLKGAPQPGSALPKVFSKAFNLGGSPPPSLATEVGDQTNDQVPNCSFHDRPYRSDFFACITSDGIKEQPESSPGSTKMLTIDESGGPALVAGWLSQHCQYGLVQISQDLSKIAMHVSFDNVILKKSMATDWAYVEIVAPHGFDEEPMAHYLHTVASHNVARPLQNGPMVTGWCSWYHYYEKITAGNLRENFFKLQSIRNKFPTNAAIVDDGYMTAWGDWHSLKPNKFPAGLKGVAEDILACGMRPGLWMAPFAADKHSKLATQHPDWLIKNDEGRLANSSYCGKFFCGLDVTK